MLPRTFTVLGRKTGQHTDWSEFETRIITRDASGLLALSLSNSDRLRAALDEPLGLLGRVCWLTIFVFSRLDQVPVAAFSWVYSAVR